MEKASAFAKKGASLVKEHPKTLLAILFSITIFILGCVNIFSLMGVKEDDIQDSETKTKVVNAKRSSYGIGFMAIIGVIIAIYNHIKTSD
jgi:hypothetical protein